MKTCALCNLPWNRCKGHGRGTMMKTRRAKIEVKHAEGKWKVLVDGAVFKTCDTEPEADYLEAELVLVEVEAALLQCMNGPHIH
jgi:hypothetical protein